MELASLKQALGRAFRQDSDFELEQAAYRRLVDKGFAPDAIIDVGAYEGEWTRMARKMFGVVPCLMAEANPDKGQILEKMCRDLPLAAYVLAPLSRTAGERVTFYQMETGSSLLSEQSNASRTEIELTTRTLDDVADDFPGQSLFLKIDVQGAELHVLAGGQATLARCAVVQLEVALLPYNTGAPGFLEVVASMDERGFVPLDIAGESRVSDHLVQLDILFARRNSPLRPTYFVF